MLKIKTSLFKFLKKEVQVEKQKWPCCPLKDVIADPSNNNNIITTSSYSAFHNNRLYALYVSAPVIGPKMSRNHFSAPWGVGYTNWASVALKGFFIHFINLYPHVYPRKYPYAHG